jgi:hypothetical protein
MHVGEENIEYLLKKIGLWFNWIEFTFNGNGLHTENLLLFELRSNVNWIHIQLKKNEMHIGEGIENLLMNILNKKSLLKKTSI